MGLGFIVARFGFFLREFGLVVKNTSNSNDAAAVSLFGHYQSSLIGISIIILGIALILLALRNYLTTRSHIEKGFYIPSNFNIFAASLSLVFLGILIIVAADNNLNLPTPFLFPSFFFVLTNFFEAFMIGYFIFQSL